MGVLHGEAVWGWEGWLWGSYGTRMIYMGVWACVLGSIWPRGGYVVYMGLGESIGLWGGSIWSGRVAYRVYMAQGGEELWGFYRAEGSYRAWRGGAEGSPYGIHTSQVLPNPGLRELLRLVELRDAFVEAQIRRHEVRGGCMGGGTPRYPGQNDTCSRRSAHPPLGTRFWRRCREGTPASRGVP